jgi:hypothetical protein
MDVRIISSSSPEFGGCETAAAMENQLPAGMINKKMITINR